MMVNVSGRSRVRSEDLPDKCASATGSFISPIVLLPHTGRLIELRVVASIFHLCLFVFLVWTDRLSLQWLDIGQNSTATTRRAAVKNQSDIKAL